ncbi:MAG: asparaginase domain-containing protein [Pseudomonadales bacterium]
MPFSLDRQSPDAESPILVLSTGGTIDKVYFDATSEYEVGDSIIPELLREANVQVPFRHIGLMRKDSLDLSDEDRLAVCSAITAEPEQRVVVTHGTDTMTATAAALNGLTDRTIVLTGSMAPARFARTDATFNVGMAIAAVQTLPPGVYLAMNGQVFVASEVHKDRDRRAFVTR